MTFLKRWSVAAVLVALPLLCGCDAATTAQQTDGVPGAFPPTLSDTDYHNNAWTREDCMSCHEAGVDDAPKVKHVSLPDLAMDAKCRTCHVQIAGSEPAK